MNPQKNWNSFLEETLSSPQNHSLWLKSLSYLEYIGYRKMVKSLSYEEMKDDTFNHLSDEIQHSLLLGRMASDLANQSDNNPSHPPLKLRGGEKELKIHSIAENYFQSLDSKIDDWIANLSGAKNHHLSYLWVSTLIEKRAMKVYPSYFAKLSPSPLKSTIQKIIKDESEHLGYLEGYIQQLPKKYSETFSDVSSLEDQLFSGYLEEMRKYFSEFNFERNQQD